MAEKASQPRTFTGRTARHQTRWSVKLADHVSSFVITVGGIGTIAAVCLVFVLLLAVALPMFGSAQIQTPVTAPLRAAGPAPLRMAVDEYRVLGWALYPDGQLRAFRVDTGEVVWQDRLLDGDLTVRDISLANGDGGFVLARSDGKLQLGQIGFEAKFLARESLPEPIQQLSPGELASWDQGVVQVTPQHQHRWQRLMFERGTTLEFGDQPLRRLSHRSTSTGTVVAGVTDSGNVLLGKLRERKNILTGETNWQASVQALPAPAGGTKSADSVLVSGRGDNVFLISSHGQLTRYLVRPGEEPVIAETLDVRSAGADAEVTAVDLAIGGETLLVGDSRGGLRGWFLVRHSDAATPDGNWLLPVHDLPSGSSAVRSLGISQRSRMVAVGYDDGSVRVAHVTTESDVIQLRVSAATPVDQVLLAPKDDGLLALAGDQLWGAPFDPGYPEVTARSLFRPVWYEGYERPEDIWQSSFAGVQSEMKLGLAPLIFGTVKATVYSLLFGVPIALLAAIYTSEFLNPTYRNRIKPLIETMASLPSVVLGFLGGLVIAPIVERFVPATVCSLITLPVCCLLGSFLWQQLPRQLTLRLTPYRLWFVTFALATGLLAAWRLGPLTEDWLFAGDIMLWLDQQRGTGTGAWLFLFLPLSGLLTALLANRYVNPWLMEISADWSRRRFGWVNLLKFLLCVVAAVLLAFAIGGLLTYCGWDPRGSRLGTYVQRNALVVGFVMGFAIIPIIYTISEDSLSTVPRHLRSASLGAGATPLQTAVRIVVPTAMSGLFSAVMIGLGRAVGETMIVLMAAGNTPIMDWNIFNGFRTLSANIAVELPEAVRDSTHYRTLFLAALTLLLLTFVINTLAELVRLRFRRRAVQL
jgi:phosphate transport system permease protein